MIPGTSVTVQFNGNYTDDGWVAVVTDSLFRDIVNGKDVKKRIKAGCYSVPLPDGRRVHVVAYMLAIGEPVTDENLFCVFINELGSQAGSIKMENLTTQSVIPITVCNSQKKTHTFAIENIVRKFAMQVTGAVAKEKPWTQSEFEYALSDLVVKCPNKLSLWNVFN